MLGGTFRRPGSGCVRWYILKTWIRMCWVVLSGDLDQDVLGGTFRRPGSGCVR